MERLDDLFGDVTEKDSYFSIIFIISFFIFLLIFIIALALGCYVCLAILNVLYDFLNLVYVVIREQE